MHITHRSPRSIYYPLQAPRRPRSRQFLPPSDRQALPLPFRSIFVVSSIVVQFPACQPIKQFAAVFHPSLPPKPDLQAIGFPRAARRQLFDWRFRGYSLWFRTISRWTSRFRSKTTSFFESRGRTGRSSSVWRTAGKPRSSWRSFWATFRTWYFWKTFRIRGKSRFWLPYFRFFCLFWYSTRSQNDPLPLAMMSESHRRNFLPRWKLVRTDRTATM